MKTVSILVPAKNEETALPHVLRDIFRVTPSLAKRYIVEIIVIDDHSSDGTRLLAREFPVRVVQTLHGTGKGRALSTGFTHALGDYVVILDADYSHHAKDIHRLVMKLEKGAGLVIGSRILGRTKKHSAIRAIGNEFFTAIVNMCMGTDLTDVLSGFKAFRWEVAKNFSYTSGGFEIEIELIANTLRKNLPVVEIPSSERKRMGGVAKSSVIRDGIKSFLRILYERLRGI